MNEPSIAETLKQRLKNAEIESAYSTIGNASCHANTKSSKEVELEVAFRDICITYVDFLICQEDMNRCRICEFSTVDRKLILHHLKKHEEVPSYSCNQCNEKFMFKLKLDEHIEQHDRVWNRKNGF